MDRDVEAAGVLLVTRHLQVLQEPRVPGTDWDRESASEIGIERKNEIEIE